MNDDSRRAPLDMDGAQLRSLGHQLVDRIADFLDGIPEGPVTRGTSPTEVRDLLDADASMPREGRDPATLLAHTSEHLFRHGLCLPSGSTLTDGDLERVCAVIVDTVP